MDEPRRVLLVEDSLPDARLVELQLEQDAAPAQLRRIQTEEEFRAALREPWDAVISGGDVPSFGAMRVLEIVRQLGVDVPVIVISGSVGEQALVDAMRAGARDYVQKDRLFRLAPALAREIAHARERRAQSELERGIREGEQRFRFAVENTGDVLYRLRFDTLTYDYMSPGIERLTGYTPDQINRIGFAKLVVSATGPAGSRADVQDRLAAALELGQASEFWADYEVRTRSGGSCWLADHSFPWRDAEGRLLGSVGVLVDISRRKAVEERLRASEEAYRMLFEHNPMPMWVYDVENLRFLAVNEAAIQHYGYSAEEYAGMTIADIRPPEEVPALMQELRRSRLGGRRVLTQYRHRKKNGELINVEIASNSIEFGGHHARFVMIQDVTERQRLEAQLLQAQKIDAVGRLAGGVAHDFNNLITAMLGYVELIKRRLTPDSPLLRHVEEINKAAERAAALTRQLLAFSRKQVLQPKVLALGAVVEGSRTLLQRLIGEDIELQVVGAEDPGQVRADPNQIEQALLNLAINARDAMPRGGRLLIEIHDTRLDDAYTASHLGARPGRYMLLSVSDNGHGMDRETQTRIFEPFFTTKDVGKGTGLGLSMVYGIVKQSGGYITVYSEPGHGAVFKIYLPRVDPGTAEPPAPAGQLPLSGAGETILVVEDETGVRELLRETLKEIGYRVIDAADPQRALALAEDYAGRIHLVISDLIMPGLSGPELVERVQAVRSEARVLFVSGYTQGMVGERGLLPVGAAFLQKPFSAQALRAKVREVLGKH